MLQCWVNLKKKVVVILISENWMLIINTPITESFKGYVRQSSSLLDTIQRPGNQRCKLLPCCGCCWPACCLCVAFRRKWVRVLWEWGRQEGWKGRYSWGEEPLSGSSVCCLLQASVLGAARRWITFLWNTFKKCDSWKFNFMILNIIGVTYMYTWL